MKTKEFQDATGVAIRAMVGDSKLGVVWAGSGAATDGQRVWLPQLTVEEVTQEQAIEIRGYADHETGHNQHSDMNLMTKEREARRYDRERFARLLNAVEDIRMESEVLATYPECRKHIAATADKVFKNFLDEIKDHPELADDPGQFPFAITAAGRARLYDLQSAKDVCAAIHPEIMDMAKKVDAMTKNIPVLSSYGTPQGKPNTEKAVKVAMSALSMLKKKMKEEQKKRAEEEEEERKRKAEEGEPGEPGPEGEPGPKGEGEEGEGEGEGKKEEGKAEEGEGGEGKGEGEGEEEKGEEEGEGGGTAPEGEKEPEEEGTKAGGSGSTTGRAPPRDWDKDMKEAEITERFKGASSELFRSTSVYVPMTTQWDEVRERDTLGKNIEGYVNASQSCGPLLASMKRRMERALMAMAPDLYEAGHRSGKLNVRQLAQAVIGKPNVWKRKADAPMLNTAVQLVIDLSGSMRYAPHGVSRIETAQQAAILIAESLEGTGVQYEILGHCMPKRCDRKLQDIINKEMLKGGHVYGRYEPVWLKVFKNFRDPLTVCRATLGNIRGEIELHNCDGEAILMAHDRLHKRHEERKVMIVLSDGLPEVSAGNGKLHEFTKEAIAKVEAMGTTVLGVGIQHDGVKLFYSRYVLIKQVEDLSGTLLDEMSDLLTGKRLRQAA